mmetsp:Transcript_44762/g.66430  ORF Transcript_44762/g.66430 Transcript_44762/m.66430 type:complete len:138 (-) Transcript_44762:150-563(-)
MDVGDESSLCGHDRPPMPRYKHGADTRCIDGTRRVEAKCCSFQHNGFGRLPRMSNNNKVDVSIVPVPQCGRREQPWIVSTVDGPSMPILIFAGSTELAAHCLCRGNTKRSSSREGRKGYYLTKKPRSSEELLDADWQ